MVLFESSFETAGFPEWDTRANGAQVTTPVKCGTYAVRAVTDAFNFVKDFGGSQKTVYVRFYIRWSGLEIPLSPSRDILLIYGSVGEMFDIYLYNDGVGNTVLRFWSGDFGNAIDHNNTPLQSDTWYCIEVKAEVGINADCKLYLNSVLEASLSGNNDQTQPLDTIEFSAGGKSTEYDEQYLDCVVVDTSRVKCLGYLGGPYISLHDEYIIGKSEEEDYYCTLPFNLPFQRLSFALEQIAEIAFKAGHIPWEWWIDIDDGDIHFDEYKGTNKSTSIKFVAKNVASPNDLHLGRTRHSEDTKKTIQRCRIVGKSKGKQQDEISSNWQKDDSAMNTIGSFYEEILTEKMLTNRTTANALAQVNIAKKKDAIEEIEVEIERDPYPAGSYDVGDWVTIYDPKSRIVSAAYRIKRIHCFVDADGEHITLTVTNAWEDITDKLAELYRRLEKVESSGIDDEKWSAEEEGGKIDAEQLDDVWKITKKVEEEKQMQEVADPDTADSYETWYNPAKAGQIVEIYKDELLLKGTVDGVIRELEVHTVVNDTNWMYEPRFKAKFMITEEWLDDDYIDFGIYDRPVPHQSWTTSAEGFGFKIIRDSGIYKVYAIVWDDRGEFCTKFIDTISISEYHDVSAQMDWDDGYVLFYLDGDLVAMDIPHKITSTLRLMAIAFHTQARASGQSEIEFFDWTTQVLAREKKGE